MSDLRLVKTSYFANWRNFPTDFEPIGITRFPPKWWKGKNFLMLAPSQNLLFNYKNNNISQEEYKKIYLKELEDNKLTPEIILNHLPIKVILLCYEKPNEFCHRHILADWLGYKECEL